MRILAADLSLVRTGLATIYDDGPLVGGSACVIASKLKGAARLCEISDTLIRKAVSIAAEVVVLEGPAFGAKGSALCDLWGLRGVVLADLSRAGFRVVEVPPSSIKKWLTDNGNAGKDLMLATAIRALNYEGSDNNEADAWALAHMAYNHLTGKVQPAYRAKACAAVDWEPR